MNEVGMGAHAFDPWEVETGGSEIQGHSQPCSKFKTNLGYTKCCLKKSILNKLLVLYTFLVKKLEFISGFLRVSVNT